MIQKSFERNKHIYHNEAFAELIKDAVRFFNGTPVHCLPPPERFSGTGVYALYYTGSNPIYKRYAELNRLSYDFPIYVGKAVPTGWRQSSSLGGKHKAHHDSRDMFPYAIKCIERLQPKAFFFENVKGLLRTSFAEYFDYIILRLTYPTCTIKENEDWLHHLNRLRKITTNQYNDIKYKVEYKLLNAAHYGIPQKRERVVIIGIRSDLDVEWTFPQFTHTEDRLNWDKFVTAEYWDRHELPRQQNVLIESLLQQKYGMFPPEELPWQTIRDALVGVPHPQEDHNIPDHIFKGGARIYPGHSGSKIDQPSKTIKAGGHGVPGGENLIRYEDGSVRYFTIFEAKLIQTFPQDFIITGAWGEAMRQIGNAVPVRLSEIIGKQLLLLLHSNLPILRKAHATPVWASPESLGFRRGEMV
ncbi:DNA (cytosine-5-)-methyltransferase [Candidatus Oscillochloris fontis]|uniref:DNA (cytosine-5-)-methyltransferase n=1 Tax=Candidatus Oscillochloris fontis TaxID=2496868 RepID=UPI00101D185D|nr:DNA (cytosine-5-)-methyltransferase [Candidatus Oscillochloris fontis]